MTGSLDDDWGCASPAGRRLQSVVGSRAAPRTNSRAFCRAVLHSRGLTSRARSNAFRGVQSAV
eukprot:4508589-Prymnesium_polylepis.1